MFWKLVKHELLSNKNYIIAQCISIVTIGFLCGILNCVNFDESVYIILIIIGALLIMSVNVFFMSQIINTFKKNAFENRQILFQLPTSIYEIVGSKLFSGIVSIVLTIIAFNVVIVIAMLFSIGNISNIIQIISSLTSPFFLVIEFFIFMFLIASFNAFMMISAMLNTGSLNGNKDVWYVFLLWGLGFLFTCVIQFDPIGLAIMTTSSNDIIITSISNVNYIPIMNVYPFIVLILGSIIMFFGTVHILEHNLELD